MLNSGISSALTAHDGLAVSAEDLDLAKFFNATDDLLGGADASLVTTRSASVSAEVPGASMPTSPIPPALPAFFSGNPGVVPSSPTGPTPAAVPFGAAAQMITPETIAAMNMHTLSLGLALPALHPLQMFNPAPFAMSPMDLATAAAAFAGATPSIVPAALLPQNLQPNAQQALSASLLRDGLAGMSSPALPLIGAASPTAPTPPATPASPPSLSSPNSTSSLSSLPPKAPTFGRSSSVETFTPAMSPSALASGLSSTTVSSPASPEPADNATSPQQQSVKPKKKRRPKPRMCELSETQAQAKRDANRESARKCRERKRAKERVVMCEKSQLSEDNDQLRAALAAEKAKNEILSKILMEKEAYISGLHKRIRLDPTAASA